MATTSSFKKTDKQKEAVRLMAMNHTTLLYGGGRSGKTGIIIRGIWIRAAKYPGTDHLIARFRFNHVKQSIAFQTMPRISELMGVPDVNRFLNKSDWMYELPNDSRIWLAGLDDKERVDKILGLDFATIFENEASQISFDAHETLMTRLNPPSGIPGKNWIDYNPPPKSHWGYKIFHERKFPDGRSIPSDDFASLQMNPDDNRDNISEEYFDTLSMLSEGKRKRFEKGEYADEIGALWQRGWFHYNSSLPESFLRIVVGVDPSGSVEGDEIGIIIGAQIDIDKYILLDDYSCHGTPAEWAKECVSAYDKWHADILVAEKNFGGDMVESTIKNAGRHVNVKLITSSRGKIVRAEPISALYEHGQVEHRLPFLDLEDEYCTYTPDVDKSPNRMDAAVFVLAELSGANVSMLDVV